MLLALRSLWEEQQSGVVTGTMAVTGAAGTAAATATTTSESRLVGGKKRKLRIARQRARVAQWSEATAPQFVQFPPLVITGVAAGTAAATAECRMFGGMVFAGTIAGIGDAGYSNARGALNTDALERDEAFMQMLMAA